MSEILLQLSIALAKISIIPLTIWFILVTSGKSEAVIEGFIQLHQALNSLPS